MRSPANVLLAVASLAVAASSFGCSAHPAPDTGVSEGELSDSQTIRKGDEFVRCWTVSDGNMDEFFREYALTCRVSSKGLTGLAGSSVFVDASAAGGSVVSGAPGDSPDHDVVLGRVHKSDFPLSLSVYGSWAANRSDTISGFHLTVPAAEGANEAAPVIVKLPFDTWPVTFLNRGSFVVVGTARYDVQAAPFVTDQNGNGAKTTFSTSASTGAVRGPSASLDLLAPPSGGIALDIQSDQGSFRSTITAPGIYVIEGTGLRLATADEQAAAGTSPSDPGLSPGAGPSIDAPPAMTPPPATACGGPGQAYCAPPGGGVSCNAGTRADTDHDVCVACGNDGQTYCVIDPTNFSGNWHCNTGTRWDTDAQACIACGSLGKTYCVADPNNISGNWVCDAGLSVSSSDQTCTN